MSAMKVSTHGDVNRNHFFCGLHSLWNLHPCSIQCLCLWINRWPLSERYTMVFRVFSSRWSPFGGGYPWMDPQPACRYSPNGPATIFPSHDAQIFLDIWSWHPNILRSFSRNGWCLIPTSLLVLYLSLFALPRYSSLFNINTQQTACVCLIQ